MNFDDVVTENHCGICVCKFKGGREKYIISRKHKKKLKNVKRFIIKED